MMTVYFIDTSVLLNILNVPYMNQDRDLVYFRLNEIIESGEKMVLPWATIVETGNHIAHVSNGNLRRSCAIRFSDLIIKTIKDEAPWAYNKYEVSDDKLMEMAEKFPECAQKYEMGLGDLSILTEYRLYMERVSPYVSVKLWSLDAHLQAFVVE